MAAARPRKKPRPQSGGGDQVYIDVKNLANSAPPLYNQQQGYDYVVANPIGRLWTVGLRAKF
jgi:hypothetical protein